MARHANRFLDVQLPSAHANGFHNRLPSTISPLYLTSPQDSTRVQLQKQAVREQWSNGPLVRSKIPGFKTSAAFLGSLRTNLRLHVSPPPSPMTTPPSMRSSATSLPPPSPLATPVDSVMDGPTATSGEDPLAGVPELRSFTATEKEDQVAALKLVADSLAQMRQTANTALIFHPLNMAVAVAVVSLVARYMTQRGHDLIATVMACVGIIMTAFALCRYSTQTYLNLAEEINWGWLGDADILVTKFGDDLIGVLVLQWVSGESRQKRKKAWKGEIQALAVKLKYRGKGVGTALLEDAVKEARKKGAESIEFSDNHAHAARVLPNFYNGSFNKRDRNARNALEEAWQSSPTRSKRKS